MIVTLKLPDNLHELAEKVATASRVSQETVLLEWLEHPIQQPGKDDYELMLEALDGYSAIQLWTLVYRPIAEKDEERYQVLKEKENLSRDEKAELESIVELTNINILLRAKALAILKERGENIDVFLERNLD